MEKAPNESKTGQSRTIKWQTSYRRPKKARTVGTKLALPASTEKALIFYLSMG
ncbi:hypothetical protein OU800_09485 [Pseudomonas sp. GOM7]|uniref:hypothetical protein n=1 Tax=Pseudomonas sp. GOM7 TaxID=2998079 RepID=UPI00227D5699|nr:hypothetical protein [Pseudomonas sp. GOM7]WAJ39441.1 hypothetical protein OU800_09485 [Pseudomonas sp. GOM7]